MKRLKNLEAIEIFAILLWLSIAGLVTWSLIVNGPGDNVRFQ